MQPSSQPSWATLPTSTQTPQAGPSSNSTSPPWTPAWQPAVGVHGATAASAGAPPTTSGQQRKRLPQAAYDIMIHYFDNVNDNPDLEARRALAHRINQNVEGCNITPLKIYQYFATKRTRKNQSNASVAKTREDILYPSLIKEETILAKLDILLDEDPNPSRETAKIYAQRLGHGAKAVDIVTYAKLRLLEKKKELASPPAVVTLDQMRLNPFVRTPPLPRGSQLPTPGSSTSPEPPQSAMKAPESTVTPGWRKEVDWSGRNMDPDESEDEDVKDELVSEDELDSADSTGASRGPSSDGPFGIPLDSLQGLAAQLQDALSKPSSLPEDRPKTFAELSRWLKSDTISTTFLNDVESGVYAPLGLVPASLASASRQSPPK